MDILSSLAGEAAFQNDRALHACILAETPPHRQAIRIVTATPNGNRLQKAPAVSFRRRPSSPCLRAIFAKLALRQNLWVKTL